MRLLLGVCAAVTALSWAMGCSGEDGADSGSPGDTGGQGSGVGGSRPSPSGGNSAGGTGGNPGTGGAVATGGARASGGASASGGGRPASGTGGDDGNGSGGDDGNGSGGDDGNGSGGDDGNGSGGDDGNGSGGDDGNGSGGTSGSGGAGGLEGVELIDDVEHAGVPCLLIRTETADYYFDKDGAGFASIYDKDGRDWVSWSRASGHRGDFRGIPNMGPCCHPGYTGALTTVTTQEPNRVVVRSVPEQGNWETRWEFFPDVARLTVVRAPGSYYLLYEGTPGDAIGPEDRIGFSDGRRLSLSTGEFLGDLPNPEWVYFLDTDIDRALLVLHPQDDAIADTYWTFDTMTVFGFGRTCQGGCTGMSRNGDRMVLAFSDDTDFQSLSELASDLLER